jgi:hypothetical protein
MERIMSARFLGIFKAAHGDELIAAVLPDRAFRREEETWLNVALLKSSYLDEMCAGRKDTLVYPMAVLDSAHAAMKKAMAESNPSAVPDFDGLMAQNGISVPLLAPIKLN